MQAYVNYYDKYKELNREILIYDVYLNKWEDIMVDNKVIHLNNPAKKRSLNKNIFT